MKVPKRRRVEYESWYCVRSEDGHLVYEPISSLEGAELIKSGLIANSGKTYTVEPVSLSRLKIP